MAVVKELDRFCEAVGGAWHTKTGQSEAEMKEIRTITAEELGDGRDEFECGGDCQSCCVYPFAKYIDAIRGECE